LQGITRITRASAGKVLIKEGEVGSELYSVYSGSVEIKKRIRAGDDYTVVKLDASQNVFFGELALIDDDKRSATVIATLDSEFIVISKEGFLAGRLRKTTGDMLTLFDALVNELEP